MYEIRVFKRSASRPARWSTTELIRSIETAKSALAAPGDRAVIWSTDMNRRVWEGFVADGNRIVELMGG